MTNILDSLRPQPLWNYFSQLCEIPRPSGEEEAVRLMIIDFAKAHNLDCEIDSVGNVVVRKPATAGMEDRKGVILQSHLDMVAQKNNAIQHDFSLDPITPVQDGDWLRANETTLGADNGVGVAAAMAVLSSETIAHGPIEALFTIDEESGMTGAEGLKSGWLNGEILFNLDSEDEKELFVGCAGGVDIIASGSYTPQQVPENSKFFEINVSGLKGGHSGCDIHLGRGNANKIMNRVLKRAIQQLDLAVSSIDGGSLRNAIPRESIANIVIPAANVERFRELVAEIASIVREELKAADAGVVINLTEISPLSDVMPTAEQTRWLNALYCCPNGVQRMSDDFLGVVETSNNLAHVLLGNGKIKVECMVRSLIDSSTEDLTEAVRSCFSLAGGDVSLEAPSPGWRPNTESPILRVVSSSYEKLFARTPAVTVIHAGLECGLLGGTYPEWDMISFGPTIKFPHSPDEKVHIPSVEKFWHLLCDSLTAVPEKR